MSAISHEHLTLELSAQASGFGASITGLDLRLPLSPPVLAAVKRAWAEHSIVYFPSQPLDLEQLAAFTLQFGEFGVDPYVEPLAEHPHVLEVRREADEKASIFGAAWHSDWSFQKTPPSATILHAKVVPPVGGDTLFVDCYRAYDALSPSVQTMLAGLETVHSASAAYGPQGIFATSTETRAMKIIVSPDAEKTEVHPLVRTHPVSGRKALFINPVYTVGVAGLRPEESKALLDFLFKHMLKDEFRYRHKWAQDMLTMWDNRCTMHYADGGYDGHLRVMHRTTVAGERPYR